MEKLLIGILLISTITISFVMIILNASKECLSEELLS